MNEPYESRRNAGLDPWSIVWGLILIAIGAWFFVEVTLGIDLPAIPWRQLWPIFLIVLGAVILLQAQKRRSS